MIASKQGVPLHSPARRFTREDSNFCSKLLRSFQEPSYCVCHPHSSCYCTRLEHYVSLFSGHSCNDRISQDIWVWTGCSVDYQAGKLVFLIIMLLRAGLNKSLLENWAPESLLVIHLQLVMILDELAEVENYNWEKYTGNAYSWKYMTERCMERRGWKKHDSWSSRESIR